MVRASPRAKATKRGLNARYREVARRFSDVILRELGGAIHSVVLYGSVARNQARRESDIDVLIIGTEKGLHRRLSGIADDLMEREPFEPFMGLFYLTKRQFQVLHRRRSSFLGNVLREGLVLYDDGTLAEIRTRSGVGMTTEGSRQYAEDYLREAGEALKEAEILLEQGFRKGAINRAYYAMFYAATAALYADEASLPRKHSSLINLFRTRLVETGKVERTFHTDLASAFRLRQRSDYEVHAQIGESDIEETVRRAEAFVREMRRLVGTG